jgi:hypothetical protein
MEVKGRMIELVEKTAITKKCVSMQNSATKNNL